MKIRALTLRDGRVTLCVNSEDDKDVQLLRVFHAQRRGETPFLYELGDTEGALQLFPCGATAESYDA